MQSRYDCTHGTALQPMSMLLHAPCRQLPYMVVHVYSLCKCTMRVKHGYQVSCFCAGIAGVVRDEPRSNNSSVQVSYPAYPTLQPITSEPPASSYNQYTSPPQQDYNSYDQASFYQQPQMHQQSQPQAQTQPHQHQQQQSQPYPEYQGSQLQYGASPYGQQPAQAPVSYQVTCRSA